MCHFYDLLVRGYWTVLINTICTISCRHRVRASVIERYSAVSHVACWCWWNV